MVENNTAGLLEKLRIGPDALHAAQSGPGRSCACRRSGCRVRTRAATGFGWHFEELGGFLRVQGYPDGPDGGLDLHGRGLRSGGRERLPHGAAPAAPDRPKGAVVELAQVENMTVHIGDVVMDAA